MVVYDCSKCRKRGSRSPGSRVRFSAVSGAQGSYAGEESDKLLNTCRQQ